MAALVSRFAAISGIEEARGYDELPAILTVFPTSIILPISGTQLMSAGGPQVGIHKLRATLFFANQILPEAYGLAVPFIGKVARQIAAQITLGGLVSHVSPIAGQEFYEGPGGINYGIGPQGLPLQYLGIHFNLEVKEIETFTVSA